MEGEYNRLDGIVRSASPGSLTIETQPPIRNPSPEVLTYQGESADLVFTDPPWAVGYEGYTPDHAGR